VLFIAHAASFPRASLSGGKEGCTITKAPDPPFVPPSPFDGAHLGSGEFFYGTPALWALVEPHWQVHAGEKLPYFRQGYDGLQENSTVSFNLIYTQ
jgi:hypothetical protein